jgi:hypothetical protein
MLQEATTGGEFVRTHRRRLQVREHGVPPLEFGVTGCVPGVLPGTVAPPRM